MNTAAPPHKLRVALARALAWTRRLYLPLALGFIGYSAFRAGDGLLAALASASYPCLALAAACWAVAQWLSPLSTRALARCFDIPLGYRKLALIAILRIPAKYLPGGIWQSVARFTAYREHAVKGADSLAILVIEHLVALGVSASLGAWILLESGDSAMDHLMPGWILAAGITLLLAPLIWLLCRRRPRLKHFTSILQVIASVVLFWCIASMAFVLYWTALFGSETLDGMSLVPAYLLSWAAGFAAVFAPQGVGVFEWSAAHLLATALPISLTITALAGFRIITIIGDLVAWTLGIAISRRH